MKIGIDLHGVSDAYPTFFAELSKLFVAAGHEVHLMTGELITDELHAQLRDCNISYTHLFSISQYHQEKGTPMRFDEKNTPWIDDALWMRTKGDYAAEKGLDIVLDDTEQYADHFTTPFVFCRGFNKEAKAKVANAQTNGEAVYLQHSIGCSRIIEKTQPT